MYKKKLNSQIHPMIMYKSKISTFIFLISLQILLVASQLTNNSVGNLSINDRSCNVDSDCSDASNNIEGTWFNQTDKPETRLGNFMCIQQKCKFVVAAGQQCRAETDCAAYYYSISNNIPLNDQCSPAHCNLGSKCAWNQNDIPSIPNIDNQLTCCAGLPSKSICEIVANDVDPCGGDSKCVYDRGNNIAKCSDDGNPSSKQIWIGVLICLLGSVTLNIGLNIQKFAFTKYQEEMDIQQQMVIPLDDDNNSVKNSNASITDSLNHSSLYKKLEKFMFWKQIVVSPLWVMGLGVYIVGSVLNFIALKFAPQSLVAPLGAVSLVVNLLIAPILHHQKLTKWDIVGVLIIICGSVVITVFSGIVAQDYTLCVLIELFKRTQTIVYLACIGFFIFSLYTFIRVIERNAVQKDADARKSVTAVVAAAVVEQEQIENKNRNSLDKKIPFIEESNSAKDNAKPDRTSYRLSIKSIAIDQIPEKQGQDDNSEKITGNNDISLDEEIRPATARIRDSILSTKSAVRQHSIKEKVLLPLAYAILASSMATITTLFAKSLINLLSVSFSQNDNQFDNLLSWAILFITISTAIGQIYWISMGLKKYDALLQVPIFYCNWSLFDIIGGGIYYDEFRRFDAGKYAGFTIGVSFIFFGVALLSKRLAKLTKEEEKLKEIEKEWEDMKKKRKRNNNNNSRSKSGTETTS